ncbi:hypothetical protein AB7Z49_17495 [Providencia rettgeri]
MNSVDKFGYGDKQIQQGMSMADSSPKCNAKPPFLAPQTPPKVV